MLERVFKRAEKWQNESLEYREKSLAKFEKQIETMIEHSKEKAFLIELLDISFRSSNYKQVYDKIQDIFKHYGKPTFLKGMDGLLVDTFLKFGRLFPSVSVPLFIDTLKKNTKSVVIDTLDLENHLLERRNEHFKSNINQIGEIVIGEEEAESRVQLYLDTLDLDYVNYISLKISTIYSQIQTIAFDKTVKNLVKKLTRIYVKANNTKDVNGNAKFINLDMEEYRDMRITYEVFIQTLDRVELKNYTAGIVLQAYLPDSIFYYEKLLKWAKKRVQEGGAPIKVRLVKGANMEMELTESSLKHWKVAPFEKKIDTDSNYKNMLNKAVESDNLDYIRLGIASHNVFDIAYAYELLLEKDLLDKVDFEMLEGINMATTHAISKEQITCLLYAPTATDENFVNAIGYLVRRFDENTSHDNFLRYSFGLKVGDESWEKLKKNFVESVDNMKNIQNLQKRDQSRLKEEVFKNESIEKYVPEIDTDFSLEDNIKWAENIRDKWKNVHQTSLKIPCVIGGEEIYNEEQVRKVYDQSKDTMMASVYLANEQDILKAIDTAKEDTSWSELSHEQRADIFLDVAKIFRERRGDIIGVAAAEVGKVFGETDVEVSEAIDFIHFYAYSALKFEKDYPNVKMTPKGIGLVVSPWNFPVAIPVGGIVASLAAGNRTIIKASSDSLVCAYYLCKCFWDGGVSKKALQLVHCSGSMAGKHLVSSKDIEFVILTGGEDTAYKMFDTNPHLFLSAETGGKNATIVTNMADREQAIKNVCHSAFLNSGQKCSATSLLLLQEEVYDDPNFKEMLLDAAKSLKVGSVWNLDNKVGRLVHEPTGALKEAIEEDKEDGYWLLEPDVVDSNLTMLKPSIRFDIKRGGFYHLTELFGPVLGVMKFKTLDEAIDIVHETGYGLTSGIETLDTNEQKHWVERVQCGNLYINRQTTGAIVLRQPFGGMKKSAIGSGRKAGIHNYISQFMNIVDKKNPESLNVITDKYKTILSELKSDDEFLNKDLEKVKIAVSSYLYAKENEFDIARDYFAIRGEDNIFRYKNVKKVLVYVHPKDSLYDILTMILGPMIVGADVKVVAESNDISPAFALFFKHQTLFSECEVEIVSEQDLLEKLSGFDRIRMASSENISEAFLRKANGLSIFMAKTKPLMEGRFELLNYYIEQTVSNSFHRYGNIETKRDIIEFKYT